MVRDNKGRQIPSFQGFFKNVHERVCGTFSEVEWIFLDENRVESILEKDEWIEKGQSLGNERLAEKEPDILELQRRSVEFDDEVSSEET